MMGSLCSMRLLLRARHLQRLTFLTLIRYDSFLVGSFAA